MGIQERKEREKNEMQEKILLSASEIMKSEGIEGISIRKIAEKIEYSPAIVYHYFKDKEDIINNLILNNYQKILNVLSYSEKHGNNPEELLRQKLQNFIEVAVSMGEEYKIFMVSGSPEILSRTSVLYKNATADRPAVELFSKCLREILSGSKYDDNRVELVAQVIWASTFGLILRLIIEKVDENQRQLLIDCFLDYVVSALHNL